MKYLSLKKEINQRGKEKQIPILIKAVIGKSEVIQEMIKFIIKAARNDHNIFITGETGVGKELMAKKIHELSARKEKPFTAANSAILPEELAEAELFGYCQGAYTGAMKDKPGLIEESNGGTFFLDEVADLSPRVQAKILRIVEDKEIRRLGTTKTNKIDVRFIFATNKNLKREIKAGKFRDDLYYRINVLSFYILSLRERKEDIPLLAEEIIKKENRKNRTAKIITHKTMIKLLKYDYPGNIRELENILKRAHFLTDKNEIMPEKIIFEKEVEDVEEKLSSHFSLSESIYEKLKQGADYWKIVHEPFKRNELNKDQVWEIINSALKETENNKFKEAITNLNIDLKEYKRFLNSLRRYRKWGIDNI